jgi:hypothetical protein
MPLVLGNIGEGATAVGLAIHSSIYRDGKVIVVAVYVGRWRPWFDNMV